jgi:hypothetical protein
MGMLFAIKSLTFLEAAMLGRPQKPSMPLSAPLRWVSRRCLERPARAVEAWARRRWPAAPAETAQAEAPTPSEPAAQANAEAGARPDAEQLTT